MGIAEAFSHETFDQARPKKAFRKGETARGPLRMRVVEDGGGGCVPDTKRARLKGQEERRRKPARTRGKWKKKGRKASKICHKEGSD